MGETSSGSSNANLKKRKISIEEFSDSSSPKMAPKFSRSRRGLFKDYNHIYTDDNLKEYQVLLSSSNDSQMDILKIGKILKSVQGLVYVRSVGPSLVKIFLKTKSDANNFILNTSFLGEHHWIARIPYDRLESQGIIQVPVELTEEEMLGELQASVDIIGVKRFQKKLPDGSFAPLRTVLVTFLSSSRPDHVTLDYLWFDVKEYIKPLLQCFKCYKFGHGSRSCKAKQICSICSNTHYFKDCDNKDNIRCSNCSGDHVAVSFSCPIKAAKIKEIRNRISGKMTYATVTSQAPTLPSYALKTASQIPPAKSPSNRVLITDIINSDTVLNALIKTVMSIIMISQNDKESKNASGPISSKVIKEMLITNLAN